MSDDPNKRRRRSPGDRDQDYVINLVDEALGEQGLREHRFDWLLGDPGRTGLRAFLPVDATTRAAGWSWSTTNTSTTGRCRSWTGAPPSAGFPAGCSGGSTISSAASRSRRMGCGW
jgi:hypothetical protein